MTKEQINHYDQIIRRIDYLSDKVERIEAAEGLTDECHRINLEIAEAFGQMFDFLNSI